MNRNIVLALLMILNLLSVTSVASAGMRDQMNSLRFDLLAVGQKFNLVIAKQSPGSIAYTAWYMGEKAKTAMEFHKRLKGDWEEVFVTFVAQGDGEVQANLQGEWYSMNGPDDIRHVWIDDVRVDGAQIANGDFEEATPQGRPAGWNVGDFRPKYYSCDGSIAKSGKVCAAIWIGNTYWQRFPVKKDGTYTVRLWVRTADPAAMAPPVVVSEYTPQMYRQQLQVTFRTPEAAAKAKLRITPLFNGCAWSMGSRWDDNNGGDIQMRGVLAKHGQHGTYYLNAFYKNWTEATPKCESEFGRELLKTGDSVGCHSLTHPMLSYCNRNRIFEEMVGDRILWEAAIDRPVSSYSFSYCNFYNEQDGLEVQKDIARVLMRSGFLNIANEYQWEAIQTPITLCPILPGDGADIDAAVDAALSDPAHGAAHPNVTHSMHMYYDTPAKWAKFEGQLDKYGRKSDWWYCNNNQYGAYRYQLQTTTLGGPKVDGKTLTFFIERPVLVDVNDEQPLTFEVTGVAKDDVVEAKCATAECVPSPRKTDAYLLNLSHDRDQSLPKKIGLVPPNYKNRDTIGDNDYDSDFADLKALLHWADGELKLAIQNNGKAPLTDLRVTYRLPLAWKEGVTLRKLADVGEGKSARDTLKPTLLQKDYKYNSGNSFFVAQLDFRRGGAAGRLHLACLRNNPEADHSYPGDGFIVLGPMSTDLVDRARFVADVAVGKVATQNWILSDNAHLSWAKADPMELPFLDVELIPAGKWFGKPAAHVLASTLKSEVAQKVEFRAYRHPSMRILLAGKDVTNQNVIDLPQGESRLIIITEDGGHTFLRVLKPGTDHRVTNIQFIRPQIEAEGKDAYRPEPAAAVSKRTLAGKWRATIVTPMAPAPTIDKALKDPGISDKAAKLVAADASKWQEVDVPCDWDNYGSEWPKIDGEAVFQRILEVPAEWAGKDLEISLGPVDDYDDTFFNGVQVGKTDAKTPNPWRVPRVYKVPGKLVKAGRNVLSVRVFDDYGSGGMTGAASEMFMQKIQP